MDLVNLTIEKVIIHEVPNQKNGKIPTLSGQIIILPDESRIELTRRITEVLGRDSNCVEMSINDKTDASASSIVSSLIEDSSDSNFLTKSQALAQKLHNVQDQ